MPVRVAEMEAIWRSPAYSLMESRKQYPDANSNKAVSSEPSMTLIRFITPLTQANVKCSMCLLESEDMGRYKCATRAGGFLPAQCSFLLRRLHNQFDPIPVRGRGPLQNSGAVVTHEPLPASGRLAAHGNAGTMPRIPLPLRRMNSEKEHSPLTRFAWLSIAAAVVTIGLNDVGTTLTAPRCLPHSAAPSVLAVDWRV